jgi:hypothetical protein
LGLILRTMSEKTTVPMSLQQVRSLSSALQHIFTSGFSFVLWKTMSFIFISFSIPLRGIKESVAISLYTVCRSIESNCPLPCLFNKTVKKNYLPPPITTKIHFNTKCCKTSKCCGKRGKVMQNTNYNSTVCSAKLSFVGVFWNSYAKYKI